MQQHDYAWEASNSVKHCIKLCLNDTKSLVILQAAVSVNIVL